MKFPSRLDATFEVWQARRNWTAFIVAVICCLVFSGSVCGQVTYTVLHSFGSITNDGSTPYSPLVQGTDLNFYGTTTAGGSAGNGTVFKMTSDGTVTILHNFGDGTTAHDGAAPYGGLVQYSTGPFYGTTYQGGTAGDGTLYLVTSTGAVTIMHNFHDGSVANDGINPRSGLVLNGNLALGTTAAGGSAGDGTTFSMIIQGTIFYNLLHSFLGTDGISPYAALIQASDGNYYGTTHSGGPSGYGEIFKMTTTGAVTVVNSFSIASLGENPFGSLIQGTGGLLYGTNSGSLYTGYVYGTVYSCSRAGSGTVLHSFSDYYNPPSDGETPEAGLVQGSDGNYYGTTYAGGTANFGTIFKMTSAGTITILHNFGDGTVINDGKNPMASMIFGHDGNLYGTTSAGGASGKGTLFKMVVLPPTITSAASTTFYAGYAGSFTVTGTGSPTFSATGLPSWATLNATTGVLSGTPPDTSGAPFTITLTASNSISPTATQTFTLNVLPPSAPTFTDGPAPAATVGVAYGFDYQATGYPKPAFTLLSGSLPPGLTLSSTGLLTGTPTTTGVYTGTVDAGNTISPDATQNFSITVSAAAAPAFSNGPPPATTPINSPYSFTYQGTGSPAINDFYVSSGFLPYGLSLSPTGVISGTPTTAGEYTGTVTAYNGVTPSAIQAFDITVQQAPAFTSAPLATTAIVGTSFGYFNFIASGSPAPTYAVTSGGLPPGLTLTGGQLTGYPTQSGTYAGTITASNGVGSNATQNFSIKVLPIPVVQYTILHQFGSSPNDGSEPETSLVQGSDGNLYGTTIEGGTASDGVIFQITPQGAYTIIHNFGDGSVAHDGDLPLGALIPSSDGQSLYGTTLRGGSALQGAIFKTTLQGAVTVLHSFDDGSVPNEGSYCEAGLTLASDGNFYGTTSQGGTGKSGTVFEMTPAGVVTTLHNFSDGSVSQDGVSPEGPVIQSTDGNLYGTTYSGGANGVGTVFKMTLQGSETVLLNLQDGSGVNPTDGVLQGSGGVYYFTTTATFTEYSGTGGGVFGVEANPPGYSPTYGEVELTSLAGWEGALPKSGVIEDANGYFYGTAYQGGSANQGTLYSVSPFGAVTALHNFQDDTLPGNPSVYDGYNPVGGVVQGSDGSFYGTTQGGGIGGGGVIYKLTLAYAPSSPVVTTPASPTLTVGQSAAFSVTADGTGPFTYQWLFNGSVINGATGSSFTIPSVATTDSGNYSVTLTNAYGNVTSTFFALTVTPPAPASDTPAMPAWALALLGALLLLVGPRYLRRA